MEVKVTLAKPNGKLDILVEKAATIERYDIIFHKSINDFSGDVPEIVDFFEYLDELKSEN